MPIRQKTLCFFPEDFICHKGTKTQKYLLIVLLFYDVSITIKSVFLFFLVSWSLGGE